MAISAKKRLLIYRRDGFKCLECGVSTNLTLDHIVPQSKGGGNQDKNLRTLCESCNLKKGNWHPSLFERITCFFFSRQDANKMRNEMLGAMASGDVIFQQKTLLVVDGKIENRIQKIKPSLEGWLATFQKDLYAKDLERDTVDTTRHKDALKRDEALLKYCSALAEKVEELETIIRS